MARTIATIAGDTPAVVVAHDYEASDPLYVIRGMNSFTHPGWMGPVMNEISFVFSTDAVADEDDRGGVPHEAVYEALNDHLATPAAFGTSVGDWLANHGTLVQGDWDDFADALATAIGGTYTPPA